MDSVEILSQSLAAINSHDVKALTGRQITSSWTRWVIGLWAQAPMEAGWRSYFQMCPDYRVRGDHVFAGHVNSTPSKPNVASVRAGLSQPLLPPPARAG